MKNDIKDKIRSATVEFLDVVLGVAESLVNISADRRSVYKVLSGSEEHEWTVHNITQCLNSLKQKGYIEVVKNSASESIIFKNKAKLKVIDNISNRLECDQLYRFVSFDIPEEYKHRRDRFRRTLKGLGFRQIQKSLWVTNKNIGDFVEIAAMEYKIYDYIVYLISENTNINNYIEDILTKGD